MPAVSQHPFHIFECLRELNNIMFSPVRDFSAYSHALALDELPLDKYSWCFDRSEWPYWLELIRPEFNAFPRILPDLAGWVADWGGQTPEQMPRVRKYARASNEFWQAGQDESLPEAAPGPDGERFDAEPERVISWLAWLGDEWLPWAEDNVLRYKAILAYDKLRDIHQELQRSPEQFELIWGAAFLYWRAGGLVIRHPLLTQKMELEYLPEDGAFRLLAKYAPARLEYDMLADLPGIDVQKFFALERELFDYELDLRENGQVETVCGRLAEMLGHGCRISRQKEAWPGQDTPLIVCNEQILFVRRLDGRKWRGELEGIVEAIDAGATLPGLFDYYYRNFTQPVEPTGGVTKGEPLFPWGKDEVHEAILRALADNSLTVAQAPPQNKKEFLVANLVAHLLSQGKRVLVTGAVNGSLRQVGELIHKDFPALAPLCVTATNGDLNNLQELLRAFKTQCDKLTEYEQADKTPPQDRLTLFREELAEDKQQMQAAREIEYTRRFMVEGRELTAWQTAKWLGEEQARLGYIPDMIGHDKPCPLDKEDMERLFSLSGQVSLSEGDDLSLWFPSPEELMDGQDMAALFTELAEVRRGREQYKDLPAGCWPGGSSELAAIVLAEYQQALAEWPCGEAWLAEILREVIEIPHKNWLWQDFCQTAMAGAQKAQALADVINIHKITLPDTADPQQLREYLYDLRMEFHKNAKLGLLFKITASRGALRAHKECLIDGAPARGVQDIDILLGQLDFLGETNKLLNRWNASLTELQGPLLDKGRSDWFAEMSRRVEQIKQVLDWRKKYFDKLREYWQSFSGRPLPDWTDRDRLLDTLPQLQALLKEKRIEEIEAVVAQQRLAVQPENDRRKINPVCYKLATALDNKDAALWRDCRCQLAELAARRRLWQELGELYARLRETAPLWADILFKGGEIANIPDWPLAWRFAQAKSWLRRHIEGNRLDNITERFYKKYWQEDDLIRETAALDAWQWQMQRLPPEEKRVMEFILEKNLPRYEQSPRGCLSYEFSREAKFWQMSLPAWIMPIETLLETAGPFDRLFDLIIVLDGEKCDIFTTCLLLRGKKALVIGDNMQPGLTHHAQGRAAAGLILEKSLLGLPSKMKLDIGDSLYDFALRLTENRSFFLGECEGPPRAADAFANKYFYANRLTFLPAGEEPARLTPSVAVTPLTDRQASGQVNRQEAQEIIAGVTELLARPEYAGKTAGILTLGGLEQQEILSRLLNEALPEEELVRRQFTVSALGDYTGGRRDIIFASLVSARLAETADPRKINGLLGNAREQLYLFRPFAPKDLPAWSTAASLFNFDGEEGSVAALPDELFGKFATSELVRDVFAVIQQRGYDAIPEYAITGARRLDIMVRSGQRKAAVLCDGIRERSQLDMMLVQEEKLTRRGWHVRHVRGCSFYAERGAALKELWALLDGFADDKII